MHGANRLASNSLLEGLVFGARAAATMPLALSAVRQRRSHCQMRPIFATVGATGDRAGRTGRDCPAVRDLMWRQVGLVRTATVCRKRSRGSNGGAGDERGRTVNRGHTDVESLAPGPADDGRPLIAHAALRREESRGGHFRADFPARDDARWQRHVADVSLERRERKPDRRRMAEVAGFHPLTPTYVGATRRAMTLARRDHRGDDVSRLEPLHVLGTPIAQLDDPVLQPLRADRQTQRHAEEVGVLELHAR